MYFSTNFSNLDCYCSVTANHPGPRSQTSICLQTAMAPANSWFLFFTTNEKPTGMDDHYHQTHIEMDNFVTVAFTVRISDDMR